MPHKLSKQERRIVTLASLGGMLEFYDFIIYGVFSLYFASQFFPSHDSLIVVMESYLIFVFGYLARPIGGIIFSHIGDEYGRKKVLVLTIVLMGLASLGIGVLPTYNQIGIAAPILLLLLRITQGLALGGELPSTYVYINETIEKNRGIAFGITMSGVNGGLLLGMLVNFCLASMLTTEQLNDFGWRLPFIFGGLICVISYKIRKTLHETAVFRQIHDRPALPIVYLLAHHFKDVLAGIALVATMSSLVVGTIIFMPTYLHEILGYDIQQISRLMIAVMVLNIITIYLAGDMAQQYKPFLIFKVLLVMCCVLIPVSYLLININYVALGVGILAVLEGVAAMITPYAITLIFEPKIRATGVALCYNIAFTVFGGLAPLIITSFIRDGYNAFSVPVVYLLVMTFICSVGLLSLPKKLIK